MYTFLTIILLLLLFSFAYAGWRAAPWVPMWKNDLARFLELAEIKPGQKVYDLGCGDGRLICAAAQAGAQAVGLEISLFPYILAHLRILFSKSPARVKFKDFWNFNLGEADIIYFFLTQPVLLKMRAKLEKELKPGARVICYVWAIPGWQPIKISQTKNRPKMYLYQM